MKKTILYLAYLVITVVILLSMGISYVMYTFFSSNDYSYAVGLFKSHEKYGHSLRPGNLSFLVKPTGDTLSIKTDENGFRIPMSTADSISGTRDSTILFIGDSYTFGDFCHASETFPFLVGNRSGLQVINAGVGGYGYPQMLLKANDLVGSYSPEFLVFQLAPWDLDRSISGYLPYPKLVFRVPEPHFAKTKEGQLYIEKPFYQSRLWDYAASGKLVKYKRKKKNIINYIHFTATVFCPMKLHEFTNEIGTLLRGKKRRMCKDLHAAEQYTLEQTIEICKQSGTQIIYLLLGSSNDWTQEFYDRNRDFLNTHDAIIEVANAENRLWKDLSFFDYEGYIHSYAHWNSDSTEILDMHPNVAAHIKIADEIMKALSNQINKKPVNE